MSRCTPPHDSKPLIEAAQGWVVGDSSVLGEGTFSTAANFKNRGQSAVSESRVLTSAE